MEENAIGYIFGLLDDDARQEMETALAANPESRGRIERLRVAFEPLASDRGVEALPGDLALRTISRVAEYVVSAEPRVADENSPVADYIRSLTDRERPSEPSITVFPWQPNESEARPTRRRDLIASLGLSAALLLIGGTAIMTMRQSSEVNACQNSMRALHQGLETYCDFHDGRFPQVGPHEDVRTTMARFQDTGAVAAANLACPSAADANLDYAYSLGYRDQFGTLNGLSHDDPDKNLIPIVADAPHRIGGESTPINHRKGQNVLFGGGNVRFCTHPNVGPQIGDQQDDIFFNLDREPKAGKRRGDVVLGNPADRP